MLGAGPVHYYLRKWQNLNRFQNHGWESFNKLMAAFWHHRTQKGGHGLIRNKALLIGSGFYNVCFGKLGCNVEFTDIDDDMFSFV
jgi:hypothetical protein